MTLHPSSRQISIHQGSVEILSIISEFSEAVGGATDVSHLGHVLLTTLSHQTHLPQGGLWIRVPEGDHYRLIASLRQNTVLDYPWSCPAIIL